MNHTASRRNTAHPGSANPRVTRLLTVGTPGSGFDDARLWASTTSLFHLPALIATERLGLFRALAHRPLSLQPLASEIRLDIRSTRALASLMAALGLLRCEAGAFALTAASRCHLLPDRPGYWGPMLARLARITVDADTIVLAAKHADRGLYGDGREIWRRQARDMQDAHSFASAAHARALGTANRIAEASKLTGVRRLLDVGGGLGTYAIAFARREPSLKVTVLETPAVAPHARRAIAREKLGRRVRVRTFDLTAERFPRRFDAVWLSDILHDWPEPVCADLLSRVHAAMPRDGRLFVNEVLLDENLCGPPVAASYGVAMLLTTEGGQLTRSELYHLLHGAGFVDVQTEGSFGVHSLISARRR